MVGRKRNAVLLRARFQQLSDGLRRAERECRPAPEIFHAVECARFQNRDLQAAMRPRDRDVAVPPARLTPAANPLPVGRPNTLRSSRLRCSRAAFTQTAALEAWAIKGTALISPMTATERSRNWRAMLNMPSSRIRCLRYPTASSPFRLCASAAIHSMKCALEAFGQLHHCDAIRYQVLIRVLARWHTEVARSQLRHINLRLVQMFSATRSK